MAYVVTNEQGTVELGNLSKVAAFLGVKKVTKADIEAGKYPMVTLAEATEEVSAGLELDMEHKDEFAKVEAEQEEKALLSKFDTEPVEDGMEVPDDIASLEDNKELDEHTLQVLSKVEQAINDVPEDNVELFDAVCELEDAIRDDNTLTDKQAKLLVTILDGTFMATPALTNTEDTDTQSDTEYPEKGYFSDEKAIKKFIKKLSDKSLEEWCILEGVTWNPCDHESINRMRMAMAIKEFHFPQLKKTGSKKSKSKYAHYTTEELVSMALENDITVPDDKGDMRICRMYTIVALRNAGIIE